MATVNTLPLSAVSKDAKVFYILAQYSPNQPTESPVVLKDGMLSKEGAVLFSVYSDKDPFPAGTIDSFKTYPAPAVFFIANPTDNVSFSVKNGVLQGSGTAITPPILLKDSGFAQANEEIAKNQALTQPGQSLPFSIVVSPPVPQPPANNSGTEKTSIPTATAVEKEAATGQVGWAPWVLPLIIAGSLALLAILAAVIWLATRGSVEKQRERAVKEQQEKAMRSMQFNQMQRSMEMKQPLISSATSSE